MSLRPKRVFLRNMQIDLDFHDISINKGTNKQSLVPEISLKMGLMNEVVISGVGVSEMGRKCVYADACCSFTLSQALQSAEKIGS